MSESPLPYALEISEDDYHADSIGRDVPAFSKSIAHLLLTRSPAHAHAAHPKLNPELERETDAKFDVGTAAHQLILEGDDAAYVIHHDSWRTAVAKEEREYARALGKVPLLAHQAQGVREMAQAVRDQVPDLQVVPPMFADGAPERTLVWEEKGALCKARLDWLRNDLLAVDDLKTTSASAAPESWQRTMVSIGADLQQALYLRGCRAVLDCEPAFRFLVVETSPPYALTPFTLAPDALALAEKKLDYALQVWRRCLATGVWPSYPRRLVHVQSPAWAESQWADREYRDEGEAA